VLISLLIQVAAKKVMSKMWGFFAALQVIILVTSKNESFSLPATVAAFFEGVSDIINLGALRTVLDIYAGETMQYIEQQDPSIRQTGGMLIAGVAMMALACFAGLFTIFRRNTYVKKALLLVFWNLLIRFYMVAFLNYWYSSVHSLSQPEKAFATLCSSIVILLLENSIWLHLTVSVFIRWNRRDLDRPETRNRIGNLYLNLSTSPAAKLFYGQVFFV
jgi:hypothetical protein